MESRDGHALASTQPTNVLGIGGSLSKSVLVVEDDADTRANLVDILRIDSWQVKTAASVAELAARRDCSDVGLVILHRRLPEGGAEVTLPKLKALVPHAAVIVATGLDDVDGAITAVRHDAADYVLKPINPEALRASLLRIHDCQRLKHELRRDHEFTERLVSQVEAIVLVLDPHGRIVRFNPYLERISGYRLAEVAGHDWFTVFLPEHDRERLRGFFTSAVCGVHAAAATNWLLARDGARRLIEWSYTSLRDAAGDVTGVLAVGHDVTELHAAQQRAAQAERLAAIGQVMTGLTHECRNALQRSKACLELLALELQDRPGSLDLVLRIEQAQDDLHRLFEEARNYAAPIQLTTEPCDLGQLWRERWADIAHARTGKMLKLRERAGSIDLTCHVDRFAVGQVFGNVLENAVDAVPDPGEIVAQATDAQIDGRPAVTVSFHDNGPGLGPEQRRRIFEPFYTTKARRAGLGMAIARRIVERHGGTVEVADGPGPGARIVVTLPRGEPRFTR